MWPPCFIFGLRLCKPLALVASPGLGLRHFRSYVRSSVGAWMSACLIIPCFHLPSYVFSFALWTILGFSHPLIISLTHYIWPIVRPHGDPPRLLCPWWGEDCIAWCYSICFCIHCKRCKVSCFLETKPMFFQAFFSIFFWASQHCFIICWHSHIGQCRHC